MSKINGFICDICQAEVTTDTCSYEGVQILLKKLSFISVMIDEKTEKHVCERCVPRFTGIFTK
jgi:hypothetical protein